MSVSRTLRGVAAAMSYHERLRFEAAVAAAQDCPILPKSEIDPTPALPEEVGDNLTPQQRMAIAALIRGESYSAAEKFAGCCRRTLFDWRREPAFAAALERTSREALDVAVVRTRNLMMRATRVLAESMHERPDAALHAFRVLNSPRLWATASLPVEPPTDDPSPAAGSPTATAPASGGV